MDSPKIKRALISVSDKLGVADVQFCAEIIAWILTHFEDAPATLNILTPELPTKGELVARLRRCNPGLRVIWLPRTVLLCFSSLAILLQKLAHPTKPAIKATQVFAERRYDTSRIGRIMRELDKAPLPSP